LLNHRSTAFSNHRQQPSTTANHRKPPSTFPKAMPYDPTKPAENSPLSSAEMREQLNALNDDTQTRATIAQMVMGDNNVLSQSSANSNSVGQLGQSADGVYNQSQIQDIMNKIDELINVLRR